MFSQHYLLHTLHNLLPFKPRSILHSLPPTALHILKLEAHLILFLYDVDQSESILLCLPLSVMFPSVSLSVSVIVKERRSRDSITLAWQGPENSDGAIVEYEVTYYEKVSHYSKLG